MDSGLACESVGGSDQFLIETQYRYGQTNIASLTEVAVAPLFSNFMLSHHNQVKLFWPGYYVRSSYYFIQLQEARKNKVASLYLYAYYNCIVGRVTACILNLINMQFNQPSLIWSALITYIFPHVHDYKMFIYISSAFFLIPQNHI